MLLCGIEDVTPGTLLGASVLHPTRAGLELLRPGVALDATLIRRLRSMGVTQIWIHHDATADLDHATGKALTAASLNVFNAVRDSFNNMSPSTFFSGNFQTYRQVVMELIVALISGKGYAGLTSQLLADDQQLFAHSANVAYLSLVIGLEIEPYVVQERGSRDINEARDMTNLGLGAMMHDIGKIALPAALQNHHAILGDTGAAETDKQYMDHAIAGFQTLSGIGAPATMINTILHHHQRFDGKGWPDMTRLSMGRKSGTLMGKNIHIFSRIVAVANALDNLTRDKDGGKRPLVAAIHDLASDRFEGWFDPTVRNAAIRCIAPFPMGSHVTLSSGVHGVVAGPNLNHPCRPLVRPLVTGDDVPPAIDLAATPDLTITHWTGIDVRQWSYEPKPVDPPREKTAHLAAAGGR